MLKDKHFFRFPEFTSMTEWDIDYSRESNNPLNYWYHASAYYHLWDNIKHGTEYEWGGP